MVPNDRFNVCDSNASEYGPGVLLPNEHPRARIAQHGASTLSDAELLGMFLGTKDGTGKARSLLHREGSLRRVLEQPLHRRAEHQEVGVKGAAILDAALELAHRYYAEQLTRGEAMSDPAQAGAYFARKLRHLPYEVFACMFLDTRHRVLGYVEIARGTIDGAEVHPREVVRSALHHNAAAVIFGHAHPSGSPEPSAADRAITARLKQSLALVEVRVLDHFVIGDGPPTSMAQRGWV